jgi:hypothetical protein
MREKIRNFGRRKNTDLGKGCWIEHEFYDLELPILRGPGGQSVHVPDQLVLKTLTNFSTIFPNFLHKKESVGNSIADPGCLSRIPDPNFPSRILDPGSASKNLSILTQIVSKLSEI